MKYLTVTGADDILQLVTEKIKVNTTPGRYSYHVRSVSRVQGKVLPSVF